MKTILTLCLVMILSSASSSTSQINKSKDNPLIIEGSFIGERNIVCTLYKLDAAGNFIQQHTKKFKKDFTVYCEIGSNYIIQFTDESNNTKLLLVEATVAGQYVLDVDFSTAYNAALRHNGNGYSLSPINKDESKILFVQK